MKPHGLIQFRISSMLFTYPHPIYLNSFIILQSISLTHTSSPEGKGCTWGSADILKVHPRNFVPGQSTICTRSGGSWLYQTTAVDASENRKISSLMHNESRIVRPKGTDKSDSGVSDFERIFKSDSSAMLSTFVELCALLWR
jgi:hypothetical protein